MKVQQPKIPPRSGLMVTNQPMATEAHFENIRLDERQEVGVSAPNMTFDEVYIEHTIIVEGKLEKIGLTDAVVQNSDLSAARCNDGSLVRVHFKNVRLTGIDFSKSTLKDVTFESCKLDMANFRFAKLTRVSFDDCSMVDTDFMAAELNYVTFSGSTLNKVVFSNCRLKNVDGRDAELIDLRGWQSLKGLTISPEQLAGIAPQLALELGLTIAD